jgi:MFS family permease
MGYKSTTAQLMTMPPYFTACALSIAVAYAADHYKRRIPFLLGSYTAAVFGFALCASGGSPHRTYAGIFIASCGCYSGIPSNLSIITNNLAGSYKRAIGLAYASTVGVLGGAAASNFYREQDAPKYVLGHFVELGFAALVLVVALILLFIYTRINRDRERRCAEGEHLRYSLRELSEQGDKAVTFRYTL